MFLCFCFWNEFKRDNLFSAMFCFCFYSRENPPLGMLTEARLNLDTRSGKSKEIQLKLWKKWNKGKRKICHRSFTLDKSAGLEEKQPKGSKHKITAIGHFKNMFAHVNCCNIWIFDPSNGSGKILTSMNFQIANALPVTLLLSPWYLKLLNRPFFCAGNWNWKIWDPWNIWWEWWLWSWLTLRYDL